MGVVCTGHSGQVLYADGKSLVAGWSRQTIRLERPLLCGMRVEQMRSSFDVTTRGDGGYNARMPVQMFDPEVEVEMTFRCSQMALHESIDPIERQILDRLTVSELFAEIDRKLKARAGSISDL